MSHMWSLITSTVLDYEEEIPGADGDEDDEVGDDVGDDDVDDIGDATVVRDGDCFAAAVGGAGTLSTSGKNEGRPPEAEGVNSKVAMAGGELEPPHLLRKPGLSLPLFLGRWDSSRYCFWDGLNDMIRTGGWAYFSGKLR